MSSKLKIISANELITDYNCDNEDFTLVNLSENCLLRLKRETNEEGNGNETFPIFWIGWHDFSWNKIFAA